MPTTLQGLAVAPPRRRFVHVPFQLADDVVSHPTSVALWSELGIGPATPGTAAAAPAHLQPAFLGGYSFAASAANK